MLAPLLVLVATAWTIATLLLFSDGAVSIAPDMLVLYVGAGLVAVLVLVVLIAGSLPGRASRRPRWPALAYATLLLATVPSACRFGGPFRVRLALSERALAKAAANVPAGPPRVGTVRIGWLRVLRRDRIGDTVRFFTGTCELADECGVAYVPTGDPPANDRDVYQHLRGPWWAAGIRR